MDPLSQTIALLQPRAIAWRVIEAHAPWSIGFPATDAVAFGQVIAGEYEVVLPDGRAVAVAPGDFLLLAAPAAWLARTPGAGPPIPFKLAIGEPGRLLSAAAAPRVARFMAGAFVFAAPNADLLAGLMPPVIHVRGADVLAGRLGRFLDALADEALANRPGRSLLLDRLLEIILVECLRRPQTAFGGARPGLLAGLEDARIGAALRALHAEAERPWTVAALARHVGMSRSAFAARFAATVGVAPMAYFATWRMNRAKSALRASRLPMVEVARLAGYQSVSAFSSAFSRATGCPPTAWRQAAAPAAPPEVAPSPATMAG